MHYELDEDDWFLPEVIVNHAAMAALVRLKKAHDTRVNHLLKTNQITKEQVMAPKKDKNRADYKFYVGAPHLAKQAIDGGSSYITSYNDAVLKAKEILRTTGQPQVIVQIVAIVENVAPPVRVRKVK